MADQENNTPENTAKNKIPGGYILIAKKMLLSDLMKKPPLHAKLWLWMLNKASFKETKAIKRGEFITSIAEMREAMSHLIGYRKVTPTGRQIRSIYEGFTKRHMTVTTKVTGGIKITILNYAYYQTPKNYEGHNELAHERTTKRHVGGVTPIKEKERSNIPCFSRKARMDYPADFETIWKPYPNKKEKKAALAEWKKLNGQRPPIDDIVAAIEKQKSGREWQEGYVPYMRRWIKCARWEDEIEIAEQGDDPWDTA